MSAQAHAPSPPAAGIQVIRVPGWEQYPWLIHGFSTRPGGVSSVYQPGSDRRDLNLGFTPTDDPEAVEENRRRFLSAVAGPAADNSPKLLTLQQIHSGTVHRIDDRENAPPPGDGMVTALPAVLLGIGTADCIPVLVADRRQRVTAAFHAGWRGTVARIVERGIGKLRAEFGSRAEDLIAAIGPGIGQCCYAVGEEVRDAFESQFRYAGELFQDVYDTDPVRQKYPMLFLTARAPGHSNLGPAMHLDLVEANRRQLLDAGLPPPAIHCIFACTACKPELFFSHRAQAGFTGRMLAVVGVGSE